MPAVEDDSQQSPQSGFIVAVDAHFSVSQTLKVITLLWPSNELDPFLVGEQLPELLSESTPA